MKKIARLVLFLSAGALAAVAWAGAQENPPVSYSAILGLMSEGGSERKQAARLLKEARDPSLVPGLVDALFFTPKRARGEIVDVLRSLSGENLGESYYDWVELVGRRQDLRPSPGYLAWKVRLLSRIDPTYGRVLTTDSASRIRIEEIVWGGVRLDGIPSLEDPPRVRASEAGSLSEKELVFGVSLGGAHHAYPLRFVSWHEMVNDTVGGEPLTVSF